MKRVVIGLLSFRVAYGAALLVAPEKLVKSWLGPTDKPLDVALRALAAREIALHGAALGVALAGGDVRPWLAVSMAGDLSDIAATAVSRSGLPPRAATKTAVAAGGSAALTGAVLAAVS